MKFNPSSDWFNPMLVRDLRQGLRSRVFTVVFLALQGGMGVFVILGLAAASEGEVQEALTDVVNAGVIGFFLMALPLLACFAFGLEFREGRLDLLKLTQLSARGFVLGKWSSLCVQGLMVASSLLPYLVLRYFAGGVDLVTEFYFLLYVLALSALLIALGLVLSCVNQMVVRVIAIIFFFQSFFGMFVASVAGPVRGGGGVFSLFELAFGGSGLHANVLGNFILLAAVELPILWVCLEFGSARLAPPSENHDTPQRWMIAVFMAEAWLMWLWDARIGETFIGMLAVLWVFILVFAAATEPSPFPDTYRPFVRCGALGRWVGRLLLYPGWPSAVTLTLFAALAFWLLNEMTNPSSRGVDGIYCFIFAAAILFPLLAGWALRRTKLTPHSRYLAALVACVVILVICLLFGEIVSPGALVFGFLIPPVSLPMLLVLDNGYNPAHATYHDIGVVLAALSSALTILFTLLPAIRHWKTFAALERRAAQMIQASKASKSAGDESAESASPPVLPS